MILVVMMYMTDTSIKKMSGVTGFIPMPVGNVEVWGTSSKTAPQIYQVQMGIKAMKFPLTTAPLLST